MCYAESRNGFDWEKPKFGFTSYLEDKGNGCNKNNIVYNNSVNGGHPYSGGTVFKDPNGSAEERYKLIYLTWIKEKPQVRGAVSADGIHWTPIDKPLLDGYCSDTQTTAYYDAHLKCYGGYFRYWSGSPWFESWATWQGSRSWRRQIGRAVSTDFRHWSNPESVLSLGVNHHPSHDLYTNAHTVYEDIHFMFPAQYNREKDITEVYLATSRDGIHWEYFGESPVLPVGERGSGEEGQIYAVCGLVPLGKDKIAVSYGVSYLTHNQYNPYALDAAGVERKFAHLAWAMWEKDRLVAIEAAEDGRFTLIPLIHHEKQLVLNVSTETAGEVRVQLRNEKGEVIKGRAFSDCEPITGDRPEAIVSWQGSANISDTAGQVIQVDINLRIAKIFTFQFQ